MKQVDCKALMMSYHANGDEVGQREVIEAKLRESVEVVNESRKQHTHAMAEFNKELQNQACIDDIL